MNDHARGSRSAFIEANLADPPPAVRGAVVAIGNFDGVHRGHQVVLSETIGLAHAIGRPAVALTFEPHPRTVFRPDKPVFRLTPRPVKSTVMAALGLDGVVVGAFDRAFAAIAASDFITDVLVGRLAVAHAVMGWDFQFGKGRAGTPDFLIEEGRRLGFGVTCVPACSDEGGTVISSSRVRAALGAGNVAEAAGLLGWHWFVSGTVIAGDRRGRALGFPTANIALPPETGLAHGIYAVKVRIGETVHDAVASYGRRPTFDNGAPLLEVFVLDYRGDLYGKTLQVAFMSYLRPEERFESVAALVAQMHKDVAEARAALAGIGPMTALDVTLGFFA